MTEGIPTSRYLVLFAGAVFAVESGFYAVIPPLIPRLVQDVHLTTTEVGVMVSAYPAGVVLGAIPSIAMVDRFGVRITTFAGFGLLIAATLGFAWGTGGLILDAARLIQGAGGAIAWAGVLAWLTSTTSPSNRGTVIGAAVGSALIGMVLGPALGAVAALARGSTRALIRLLRNRRAAVGNGVLCVIGIVGGCTWSLTPLLINHLHGGPVVIAWILSLGFLFGAGLNVAVGRVSDRLGRLAPTVTGLVLAAPMLALMPFYRSLAPLVVTSVVASTFISGLWTPTAAMIVDAADPGASSQAVGVASMNATWAAGGAVGGVLMAGLAERAGFVVPFMLSAGLLAASAVAATLIYRRVTGTARGDNRWTSV